MAQPVASPSCFLCGIDVSSGFYSKKRKLTGSSVITFVKILDQLCISSFGKKFSALIMEDSFVCHKCKKRVEDLPDLIKKAENEKQDITKLVGKHFLSATSRLGKRKRSADQDSTSSAKHMAVHVGNATPTRVNVHKLFNVLRVYCM